MEKKIKSVRRSSVAYSKEMHTLLEELSRVVEGSNARGFRPSFTVKYGVIVSVGVYPYSSSGDGRGRPAMPEDMVEE